MSDWAWEHEKILKGTGRLISYGSFLSPDYIKNLQFTIKGKLGPEAEISGLVARILDQELETWKGKNRFLPVTMFELILRALWRIKIRDLKYLKFNDQNIYQDNYLLKLCQRIHNGEKVNQIRANMNNAHQNVDISLKFRNKNVNGELVFAKEIKERVVSRFTWSFNDISPMFKKEKVEKSRRREIKLILLARFLVPYKYRSAYSFYELPSGYHLDADGTYDGRSASSGGSWNPLNVTKK